jgi:hypothetical protein
MNCGASSTTFRWNSSARWKPARARAGKGLADKEASKKAKPAKDDAKDGGEEDK